MFWWFSYFLFFSPKLFLGIGIHSECAVVPQLMSFFLLPLFLVFQVFSEYFKELEEESIRDNFVIIYELLDELMDFGYPQTTDSKILQE